MSLAVTSTSSARSTFHSGAHDRCRRVRVRVHAGDDELLAVAEYLDLVAPAVRILERGDHLGNGSEARKISARLGGSPNLIGIVPRPSKRSLIVSSTISAASGSENVGVDDWIVRRL